MAGKLRQDKTFVLVARESARDGKSYIVKKLNEIFEYDPIFESKEYIDAEEFMNDAIKAYRIEQNFVEERVIQESDF